MLFNFQGPFPLLRAELYLSTFPEVCQQQVSVFVTVKGRARALSETALLSYHAPSLLSTPFLLFLQIFYLGLFFLL